MASRTPINGLETANQKETFQSEVFELVFTLFLKRSKTNISQIVKFFSETFRSIRAIRINVPDPQPNAELRLLGQNLQALSSILIPRRL